MVFLGIHKTTELGLEVADLSTERCNSETLSFVITDVKTLQKNKIPDVSLFTVMLFMQLLPLLALQCQCTLSYLTRLTRF